MVICKNNHTDYFALRPLRGAKPPLTDDGFDSCAAH